VILPLSRVEKAAAAISKGDLRRIPNIRGSLAIHSLVATINRMIEELNKKSEQLIQQEKMASLGTLTSGVAHELNNPLSNISSSTQILLEELGQNDLDFQQKMMRGIEEQVEKARDIVRSLLEFARENEFKPVATDVRQLIEKTIKLVHSEIPADVSIEVDIADGVVAQLDTRRMSQALINLLMNGIQSMEGCGGQVTVRALLNSDQHQLIIEVEDEGCGIDAKTIPRVFDPFFSTKDVDRGTGLGLYVTYGIIKKHNGDIAVSSRSGSGTKFIITLPTEQPSETL
jgi:signal transduction histidine kinase